MKKSLIIVNLISLLLISTHFGASHIYNNMDKKEICDKGGTEDHIAKNGQMICPFGSYGCKTKIEALIARDTMTFSLIIFIIFFPVSNSTILIKNRKK